MTRSTPSSCSSSDPGCSALHSPSLLSSRDALGHLGSHKSQAAPQAFIEDSGSYWRDIYNVSSYTTPEASLLTAVEVDGLSTRHQRSLRQAIKRSPMLFTPAPGKVRPFLTSLQYTTPPKPRGSFHVRRHTRRPSPGPNGRIGRVAIDNIHEDWDEDALSDAYSSCAAYSDEDEGKENSRPFLGASVHSSDTDAPDATSTIEVTSEEATLEFSYEDIVRRYEYQWTAEESDIYEDDAPRHDAGTATVGHPPLTICPLLLIPPEPSEETDEECESESEESECDEEDERNEEDELADTAILPSEIIVHDGESLAIQPPETIHPIILDEMPVSVDHSATVPATILDAAPTPDASATPDAGATPDATPNATPEVVSEHAQEIASDATPNISTGSVALSDTPQVSTSTKKKRRGKCKPVKIPNPLPPSPDISILQGRTHPKVCGFTDCVVCYPTAANAHNLPLHPRNRPIWCAWCNKVFHDRDAHQDHLSEDPHWLRKEGIALMEKDAENKVQCRWPACMDWIGTDSSSLKKHTTRHTRAAMRHDLCGMWVSNTSTLKRHERQTCPILFGGEKNKSRGGAAQSAPEATEGGEHEFVEGDKEDEERLARKNKAALSKAVVSRKTRGRPKGSGRTVQKAVATADAVRPTMAVAPKKKRGRPPKRVRESEDDDDDPDDSDYSDSKADDEGSPVMPRRVGAKRRKY